MWRRRLMNIWMLGLISFSAFAVCIPFVGVAWFVIEKGIGGLNWAFFTELPKGPGDSGGGMANAMIGSGIILALASVIGIPIGIANGIFLSEYGRSRTAQILRFAMDLMASTPSIVVGIFVYGLVVVRFGFSAYAGALSLAMIMLPIISRSAEEILRLNPKHLREAGLALGIPRWKVVIRILVPGSMSGLMTGMILAVARAAGETAPLLFTALGNQFYSRSLSQPTASLPVQIYNFAKSGYVELEEQAWAGAMVLVFFVLALNLMSRLMVRPRQAKGT